MIAAIIAYVMSAFCIVIGVSSLVIGMKHGGNISTISSRLILITAIVMGFLSWGFAYLGGLS